MNFALFVFYLLFQLFFCIFVQIILQHIMQYVMLLIIGFDFRLKSEVKNVFYINSTTLQTLQTL